MAWAYYIVSTCWRKHFARPDRGDYHCRLGSGVGSVDI